MRGWRAGPAGDRKPNQQLTMKTKNIIAIMATAAVLAGFGVRVLADEEGDEAISMDKVPKKVKATLAKYVEDSDVKKVTTDNEDGVREYEFSIEKDGRKYEIAITKKGKYMGTEENIDISAVPDAVQKSVAALGGKVTGSEKCVNGDNKVTYEIDIKKDAKTTEYTLDTDGKVIKTEGSGEGDEEKEGKDKD